MASSRLPGYDVSSTIQRIAENVHKIERAELALTRASSIVKAKGLSAPVVERVIASNPRTTGYSLKILEAGLCGEEGAEFESVRHATAQVGIKLVWRAAVLGSYLDLAGALLATTKLDPTPFCASAWSAGETAAWLSERHIVDPCDAFACAVLSDVGLLALVFALPDVYSALPGSPTAGPLVEFEQSALALDHQLVGQLLLGMYRFPPEFAEFAASHHGDPLELKTEAKLTLAAVRAVEAAGGDCGLGAHPGDLSQAVLEGALLKPEDRDELLEIAAGALDRATSVGIIDLPEAA